MMLQQTTPRKSSSWVPMTTFAQEAEEKHTVNSSQIEVIGMETGSQKC